MDNFFLTWMTQAPFQTAIVWRRLVLRLTPLTWLHEFTLPNRSPIKFSSPSRLLYHQILNVGTTSSDSVLRRWKHPWEETARSSPLVPRPFTGAWVAMRGVEVTLARTTLRASVLGGRLCANPGTESALKAYWFVSLLTKYGDTSFRTQQTASYATATLFRDVTKSPAACNETFMHMPFRIPITWRMLFSCSPKIINFFL